MRHTYHPPDEEDFLPKYISQNDIVAELGCGSGFYCKKLVKLAKKVYCVDIDCEALEDAKLSLNTKAVFLCESADKTSIPDAEIDVVLLANSFHDMDNKEEVVREIWRILKDDGRVLVVDWKKEKTEIGPPVNIRFSEEDYVRYFKTFKLTDKFFPSRYHYGLVFVK
ncbi:class I SAM-dependent methyltransferase [Sulfolobus acidocaldarius]|uniref:Conserved Archaeal protein n=4 Tax=Sulfolobus acidocaldarius TaxID=2285 RepID=Q4JA03_SULAC|nr:class I SAM-dependent methyltransferase [Sulfolobus acidocaldarius]AAY80387.1 conserved Archaeal protein [Sulfolobus acidocaldarius DSM 639]AGE70970.1 hypothetical protein SacN8_04995 [Sulfolobus acidocaldarius N8]AGE73241.1 hypothetical protein SacRon12I_04985 [Sulfolobus acidocaldarius Ron12/I]ALU28726.1 methyltransferase type 11 [Sulfolobus acidocaldarius]ALU31445.1 methyltransferase type 11 [Sulfolobus acidocaldarius]